VCQHVVRCLYELPSLKLSDLMPVNVTASYLEKPRLQLLT